MVWGDILGRWFRWEGNLLIIDKCVFREATSHTIKNNQPLTKHLNLTTTIGNGYCYYSYSTDEETEVQIG